MSGFSLLVELHRERSAPAACSLRSRHVTLDIQRMLMINLDICNEKKKKITPACTVHVVILMTNLPVTSFLQPYELVTAAS